MKILKKISALLCVFFFSVSVGGALSACTLFADMDKKALNQAACKHVYEWKTVAPTCQEQGYTAQICKKCDYVLEMSVKDKTPVTAHTGIGTCPTCDMDYFAEFTAYLGKTLTNYDGEAKRYTDGGKFTVNETEYYLILRYYPETKTVEAQLSLYEEALYGYAEKSVTLKMQNANGEYEYIYQNSYGEIIGSFRALALTATSAEFTVTSKPDGVSEHVVLSGMDWMRVLIPLVNEQYFPPYAFAFDMARFGFENIL